MHSWYEKRKRPVFRQPELPEPELTDRIMPDIVGIVYRYWLAALVFLIPLFVYWPVLHAGFVSEDYFYHAAFKWSFADHIRNMAMMYTGDVQYPFVRPLALFLFQTDYMVWGSDAVGFHFTNIVLHSINALLVFYLAKTIGLRKFGAAFAALFFGLFPANPEAVTWISGRFDLLACTCILLAFLFWCRARLLNDVRWMIPSVVMYLFALMTKETAFAAIALLPIIDWVLNSRTREQWGVGIGWFWKWYIVFAAVMFSFLGLRMWLFHGAGSYFYGHDSAYMSMDPVVLLKRLGSDLWMLVTPANREILSGYNNLWILVLSVLSLVVPLFLLAVLVYVWRKDRRAGTWRFSGSILGAAWLILLLMPSVAVGGVRPSLDFARFLYIPLAGYAFWLGFSLDAAGDFGINWKRVIGFSMAIILAITLTVLNSHNVVWIEAGRLSERINAAMDTWTSGLPDETTIFTVNYPFLYKGANCAPIRYEGYVDFNYGIKGCETQIVVMDPDDIEEWWSDIVSRWNRPGVGFAWDSQTETLTYLGQFDANIAERVNIGEVLGADVTGDPEDISVQESVVPEEVEVLPQSP